VPTADIWLILFSIVSSCILKSAANRCRSPGAHTSTDTLLLVKRAADLGQIFLDLWRLYSISIATSEAAPAQPEAQAPPVRSNAPIAHR